MKYWINLIKFVYFLFCILITLSLLFFLFIIIEGISISFILLLYILAILICIIGFWYLCFIKIKPLLRFLIFLFLLIITGLLFLFPNPMGFININFCADTGICREGFKAKTENGTLFIINKENCIKYGYKWIEQEKSCNLRK